MTTEGGVGFWKRERNSPGGGVTWHVKERSGVEMSVPMIQESKKEGTKGER